MSRGLPVIRRWTCFLALLVVGVVTAEEEKSKCRLRFLAVGNAPPFRQEVRDGIRYELPPPPGSIPPRVLLLERGAGDDELEELGKVGLKLGRLSGEIEFPAAGGKPVRLREEGEMEPWIELPKPGAGSYLVVIRRDPQSRTWDRVQTQTVGDDLPAGTLRFINASSQTLALVLGEKKVGLTSGKTWTTRLAPGKPAGFQLGLPAEGGGLKRILSRSLEQGPNEKTVVVLSEADRPDARTPLKVTVIRETVRKRLPPGPPED
ncbi:hypothetical protein [Haloferula sp. A504]|uniref:hypothetical protein n=1 Tax=Haloferula sp. A504 TaxID=3373601 RepID=UPI0031C86241|nr:hypothetical protein [Verrucomicrobiaceae bacterium E54]